MKKGIFHFLLWPLFLLLISTSLYSEEDNSADFTNDEISSKENSFQKVSSRIEAINFTQKGEISELEVVLDSNNAQAKKFNIIDDKQIILDIKNATATKRVMRAFDTSEFSGSIVFVSAYPRPGHRNDIRLAIQLRDNVRSILKRESNRIVLEMENRFGVFDEEDIKRAKRYEESVSGNIATAGKLHVAKSDSVEDILENLTFSGRKKYIGKKISLNVKNIAVEDLFKIIAEASGFNIIIRDEVKKLPPLTLNLTNIPWDQALDTVLGLNKLVAKRNGVILMVQSLESARKDSKAEAEAKKQAMKLEPLVTKIFPISYAETKDLSTILKDYLTANRGRIREDKRTNSLIIKDTPGVIEKMKKIIEVLDTQTPQVLIESRIVEVSEEYSKSLGLANGFSFGYDPIGSTTSGNSGVVGTSTGDSNVGPGFSFNSSGGNIAGSSNLGVAQLVLGRFGRVLDLDFRLQLLETEAKGKVISAPKVITQNKQKATLSTTNSTSYRVVTGSGDTQTTGSATVEASLSLDVTPQITNEGSISLEISVKKESFGSRTANDLPPDKTGNEVKTNVLIDNGATVVIGGVYEYTKNETIAGVPFLKDIPLLGWLFRDQYEPSTKKREVIIFITPRIINQEEAGIAKRS